MNYLMMGLCGVLGVFARFGISRCTALWVESQGLASYYAVLGTLGINILGSFLLGVVVALDGRSGASGGVLVQTLGVGFLGAFTTFSAFSVEVLGFVRGGQWGLAMGYGAGSVILGVGAAALGYFAWAK